MMRFERAFLLGFVVLAAVLPLAVRDEYLLHLGVLCLFSVVLAQSFNLMVGYVGEFPLGHVVFLGIGAYTVALGATKLGMPLYATIPAGAVVAAAAGIAIGAITLRLRGPFFVIVTLCFAEVARLIANNWIGLTTGRWGLRASRSRSGCRRWPGRRRRRAFITSR